MECKICNKSYVKLSSHLTQSHNVNSRDYKKKFGIPMNTPLIDPEISAYMSKTTKEALASRKKSRFFFIKRLFYFFRVYLSNNYIHLRPQGPKEVMVFCFNCDKPKVISRNTYNQCIHKKSFTSGFFCNQQCSNQSRSKIRKLITESYHHKDSKFKNYYIRYRDRRKSS